MMALFTPPVRPADRQSAQLFHGYSAWPCTVLTIRAVACPFPNFLDHSDIGLGFVESRLTDTASASGGNPILHEGADGTTRSLPWNQNYPASSSGVSQFQSLTVCGLIPRRPLTQRQPHDCDDQMVIDLGSSHARNG